MSKEHLSYKMTVCQNGSVLDFVAGRDFLLCPMGRGSWALPDKLPARLDDLVRVAGAVYVADTVARRGWGHGGTRPSRLIELVVEVSNADLWNSPGVQVTLKECLDFLSGDDWHLRFVADPRPRVREVQHVLPFFNHAAVSLCSGGLDSAAGLAVRLREEPGEKFIPVTVRHQSNLGVLASKQVKSLAEHFRRDLWNLPHVVVGTLMRRSRLKSFGVTHLERSHRCRAFLFAALGGVVASLTESDRVEAYESGVGAVNLPLMAGMIGSMASRSSHPQFLRLMGELLGHVSGRPIQYVLPFRDRTKGEMVEVLAQEGLLALARSTVSCVHYPLRRKVAKQCGFCPGCVFRRQAMFRAGVVERPETYAYDLFGDASSASMVPVRYYTSLKAFLQQVARLAPLARVGNDPPRLRDHLIKTGVVAAGDGRGLASYAELFHRYCREWLDLAAMGRERGWPWAEMLAPQSVAG
jgi:7-cyano-7-deazaguanine synthase in queuosine biosynthesis